jgi:hypothetical protein
VPAAGAKQRWPDPVGGFRYRLVRCSTRGSRSQLGLRCGDSVSPFDGIARVDVARFLLTVAIGGRHARQNVVITGR